MSDSEVAYSDSGTSHNSTTYNDDYQLVSVDENGTPVYQSRGQFPIKLIQWNPTLSVWTITGRLGTESQSLKCIAVDRGKVLDFGEN